LEFLYFAWPKHARSNRFAAQFDGRQALRCQSVQKQRFWLGAQTKPSVRKMELFLWMALLYL